MDLLLNWILRGIIIALGLGAGAWLLEWFRRYWRSAPERWTARIAAGMMALTLVYAVAHLRLLAQRDRIEEGRERYAIYGDPRRTEQRRGEVRGWILDCTGSEESALAYYREIEGTVERVYSLGEGGANFVGGGTGADQRDFTIEVLFAPRLREPRDILQHGRLHPVGSDLRLTVCAEVTDVAYRQLAATGRPGAVVVQDVATGSILAYAATGGPTDPPLAIKRYFPPGSVFKLALTALWLEHGLPENIEIPCPAEIQVTPRASIANYGRVGYGVVNGPAGMLVPSCNTAAVWMALRMRDEIGAAAFEDGYRRMGFVTYEENPPADSVTENFWLTSSDAWRERMSPAPSRIRISEGTGDAEWAQLAIGQGPLDVTVVGVSRFIHAIANGGVMIPPRFEYDLLDERGRGERIMSEETAHALQLMMRRVVAEGTGRAAETALARTGWRMGGKTGTAQVPGQADNGWFAGILFSPEGRARYTIVSFVEAGGTGGGAPARIAGEVGRSLAELAPDLESGS